MPAEFDTDLRLDAGDLGDEFTELMNGGFQQMAARAFEIYVQGWPVDTGLSRGGLDYRIDRVGKGVRMVFTNLQDYAIWVERRWYPIRQVVGRRLSQIAQQVSAARVGSVSLSRRGGGFAKRKFTVKGFDD